jgi:hypothetical protein
MLVEDGVDGIFYLVAVVVVGLADAFLLGGVALALLSIVSAHTLPNNHDSSRESRNVCKDDNQTLLPSEHTSSTIFAISCSSGPSEVL